MNQYKKIIDMVDDGYNYFSYRLEEVKTDDRYYIKAFMSYIELLESRTKELQEENKNSRDLLLSLQKKLYPINK